MIIPFYLGWALLCIAFLTGAGEVAVRSVPGMESHIIISAYDLWHTVSPSTLVSAHIAIQKNIGQWMWDPAIKTVLILPAWALIGIPGAALTWFCKPPRQSGEHDSWEEDSLFLIDELSRQAKEDGYGDHKDDRGIGHSLDVEFDYGEDTEELLKPGKLEHEESLFLLDELEKAVRDGTDGYGDLDESAAMSPYERYLDTGNVRASDEESDNGKDDK